MNRTFNFIGNRNRAFVFSGTLITLTFILILMNKGLNWSIDFTGGTSLQLQFEKTLSANDVTTLKNGLNTLKYGTPEVKLLGTNGDKDGSELEIIIKDAENMSAVSEAIQRSIATSLPNQKFVIAQSSLVGPKVGKELQASAMYAIILSFIVLIIYIGIRFRFPYGVAAIGALIHDVIITLGFFALMALIGGWEISLPIIAALLTIVGYSLNDTIVVFDRIRENTKIAGKHETLEDIINTSVNQTLSRTLITSGTTLVVILAILFAFFRTGNVLETFSAALLVGIGIGTYSSIFVASPILILWNQRWPLEH